ncbi:DUF4302 domain-containing protein [Capnocytophaga sp.]|uniref:DUF4302 domain-containing protein n=1 Tax=Capnocytophaga sp. TaxID=44737 RepID=UPI0026DDB907|nr:DUF4302 domain-containing protein [Capnocytophaga sp.]MDO5104714.1 DUF4302 domain-containing protein [Capnocytophaga sp.]
MKKGYITAFICAIICFSCQSEANNFEQSPSQRNAAHISALRHELTQAPNGWKMIYFSKTDSLLFSNKDEVIESLGDFRSLYGYGGHYFLVKFNEDGRLQMLSDYDENSVKEPKESLFEVKQNSFTQLSFTTYNYLHRLVNDKFEGASDFLYVGKDFRQNLLFRTSKSLEPAREYIVLEKLPSTEAWQGNAETKSHIEKAYDNRLFFDEMKNPQIRIRQSGKTFFESDVKIKTDSRLPSYIHFLNNIKVKRFYLFRFNKKPDLVYPNIPKESTGLGSGYVGTEDGISFRAGLRYNANIIFYDFKREGDTFVCELVKVYDPIGKRYMYESKHLFPNGEPTFFIAEIFDKK